MRAYSVLLAAGALIFAVHAYEPMTYQGIALTRMPQIAISVDPSVVAGLKNADGQFVITPESDPVQALRAATNTWNTVITSRALFSFSVAPISVNPRDARNAFSFADTPEARSAVGDALAITMLMYTTAGNITDSDIRFNPAYSFATTPSLDCYDLQAIATHELGHTLGADHSLLTSATMFMSTSPEDATFAHLSSDDIAFVSDAFPENGSALGGITGKVAFSSGAAISGALVLIVNPSTGFIVGVVTRSDGMYFAGGLPPGDYVVFAEPVAPYLTGDTGPDAFDPPDWQPSFHGSGESPQAVSVSGGARPNANITVPDGPARLRIDFALFGAEGALGNGGGTIPCGVPLEAVLFGKGFADTIRPEDIVIYGDGISIRQDSIRVTVSQDSAELSFLHFAFEAAPRTDWAEAAIMVRSGGHAAVYSGLRIAPSGPRLAPRGVVNAASFGAGGVAPGEIVSLFGSGIGPDTPVSGAFDGSGKLATQLGELALEFDGTPAPLFYVSSGQVNAQVPFEVAGRASTRVRLRYKDEGVEVILPVAASSVAIFGQYAQLAVVNEDGSFNDGAHPAGRGSIIVAYATGQGLIDPPLATGAAAPLTPLSRARNVTARLGGVSARVDFAGMAPGFVGLLQLNIQIPPEVETGFLPLELVANGVSSPILTHISVK